MQETKIIIDNRERNLDLLESLEEHGLAITFAQLPVGDYIISDRMCVERKTTSDFESSIMNSRLFEQAKRLHDSFEKAIVIIEGDGSDSRLGKNVLTGAMLKLYVEFNIQILNSSNAEETAYLLAKLAEKEQLEDSREPRLVGYKKAYNLYQWQLLILGSIPGVGPKLAKELIKHFKTLKNVALAAPEDLMEIDKIGKKKAEKVYEILNSEFKEDLNLA
jgi:Fanconi anemia group M protein